MCILHTILFFISYSRSSISNLNVQQAYETPIQGLLRALTKYAFKSTKMKGRTSGEHPTY